MEVTIVHLSDLHYKNDVENRSRISHLLTDLERLRPRNVIYTAFTGDLIHSGDENTYDLLFEQLIGPLISMGHEILIVPGNHDVQRSVAKEETSRKFLTDRTSTYLFGSTGDLRQPYHNDSEDPLRNFRALEEILSPYDRRHYHGYSKTIGQVSFVGLNSTWLSTSREHGDDRGNLRVEPYILESLISSLPSDTVKVALLHHPLDWLEENTRDTVSKLLTRSFDLVLFGHVHTSDLTKLTQEEAECLFVQSPPLRAGWSKGTNGYSIINCNTENKKYMIEYRSYSASRGMFVPGEDFAAGGKKYPRAEDRAFFGAAPLEPELLQRYTDGQPHDFTNWYKENIKAKSKYAGSFIVPKAHRVSIDNDDSWLAPSEPITVTIKGSQRNQFYVAPPDAGLTTAAYLAFRELSESFREHGQIPALFDANEHKINRSSILREIARTTLVRYTHTEVERLVEAGSIVVIVDGLSLAGVEQFNTFRGTAEQHFPSVRFIYFLSTERRGATAETGADPRLNPQEDEVFEFAQLEVVDIREMVKSRRPNVEQELTDAVVTHVVESFRQMDEPIFASTIAVVVETFSQDPDFKPLNKARLIERYVECLLGRFDLSDVQVGTFSSGDKIDFLSFIARRLLETNRVVVSEEEWAELCAEYQAKYLIELPTKIIDEFLEKGLLTLSNSRITFRGDYLFSFFVARQMKADPDFAQGLLKDDGLFKFHREIVFYGDLEGTDTRAVLNSTYVILGGIEETLLENYSREGINLLEEWENTCIEGHNQSSESDDFQEASKRLGTAQATPEQADYAQDRQLAEVARRRGIEQRRAVQEAEARLLVGMKLYALLIKNSLQVPADEKLRHLTKLYETGELWVGFMCAKRLEISVLPVVMAGGIRFINFGAMIDPEKSKRSFRYDAPNSVSTILSESIRNPQLSVALRRVISDLSPMGKLFARDALLEMTGDTNRAAYVSSLLDESDVNLVTASLKTLRSRFLASGRSKTQKEHLEKLVGRLQSERGVKGVINFEHMRKARIVRDLRENALAKSKG